MTMAKYFTMEATEVTERDKARLVFFSVLSVSSVVIIFRLVRIRGLQ